jgi:small-conductance mechanosensitive channel
MDKGYLNEIIYSVSAIALGIVIYQLVFFFLRKWVREKKRVIPSLLNKHIYFPGLFLIFILTLWMMLGLFQRQIDPGYYGHIMHIVHLLVIGSVGLMLIRIVKVAGEITIRHYATENPLDYKFRKVKTKFQLIERVLNFIIVFAMAAVMLMTFENIREIGSTLLASAGVLGIILGFAAQKSLGTLVAGVQIAIAQPIRLDDVVVVEGEFGTIGEITLTYVVVNTWDGRRLVVPINFFLEKSFENWTRSSPEVIGQVKVYVDYALPVPEVRDEFVKWITESPLWDKRSSGLLVTGADGHTIELRATMSARNSGDAYDLQCYIREKLITYIRDKYPHCLPKSRLDIVNGSVSADPGRTA